MGSCKQLPDTIYLVKHFVSSRAVFDFAFIIASVVSQMLLFVSCLAYVAQHSQCDTDVTILWLDWNYLNLHGDMVFQTPTRLQTNVWFH